MMDSYTSMVKKLTDTKLIRLEQAAELMRN